jgi:chromosome segregation ATPase
MSTVSSPRTAAAIAARCRASQAMLGRVRDALQRMRRERVPITVRAVARRADVSRTFLYQNPDACQLVADARQRATGQRAEDQAAETSAAEASWRERALNAEDALKAAYTEIHAQRARIGELLGRVRDLELDLPKDAVQRLLTENTTLKQQVRALTADNKTLSERLAASRDNNRAQEKKIASLQAELLDHPRSTAWPRAVSAVNDTVP